MELRAFETISVRMERRLLVTVQTPAEGADRIMASVVEVSPLVVGKYDSNSFQSAAGTERYRPLEGSVVGAESAVRIRPGVVEVSFELPHDLALLEQVVERVFQVHVYHEPVIRVATILASRSKGLDDRDNPNRWWNTTGDWLASRPVANS